MRDVQLNRSLINAKIAEQSSQTPQNAYHSKYLDVNQFRNTVGLPLPFEVFETVRHSLVPPLVLMLNY